MKCYDYYESPYGRMLLVATGGALCGAYFVGQKHFKNIESDWQCDPRAVALVAARRELDEYFGGERRTFGVALVSEGTPFQRRIWSAIAAVPFGDTISYADLARVADYPGSARAAGAATGRNPIGVLVPCHRIVGADGSLTGYAGGLETKRRLLALEASVLSRTSGEDCDVLSKGT